MTPDPNFLPGHLRLSRGSWRDYLELARFHYRPRHPRTWSQIWAIRFDAPCAPSRLAAVAVVSYPMRFATGRRRALGLHGTLGDDLRFINRHVRTITRVIVHPQFRSMGLSSQLVRCICAHSDTRYVEALAVMGRAIPFFERGGMERFEPAAPDGPVYYLYKRRSPKQPRRPNLQGKGVTPA